MTSKEMNEKIFGRATEDGNVAVLYTNSGRAVTRLDADVYPAGSQLSVRYEHPEGIVLTPKDAAKLGIEVER